MDILLRIGAPGWIIIISQFAVFGLILRLGLDVDKSTRALRLVLSRCLRESRDLIADNESEMNLARNCATRYRLAAARIEGVDAYAIANSEMSRATASRLFMRSWSYLKIVPLALKIYGLLLSKTSFHTSAALISTLSPFS